MRIVADDSHSVCAVSDATSMHASRLFFFFFYLLGRVSGVPKINHNLRFVHPRFMSKSAHDFDERIRGLLSRRLFLGEQGFTGAADSQMSLPIRLAGLGIARQKENATVA